MRGRGHQPGVDLADAALRLAGVVLLDDARHALLRIPQDAAVALRLVELDGDDGEPAEE